MNRFCKAWLALTGRLEPEVRVECSIPTVKTVVETEYVYGEPEEVEVFKAEDPRAGFFRGAIVIGESFETKAASWHGRYFASCEQAFAECPGARVNSVTIYRIDGKYFERFEKLKPIKLQPKPKVAKGRK